MKPTFHHRPVNGHFEDPTLFIKILREKRALLFDAGDIHNLADSEIYKISDIFISHTHVDHFIGFDMVLRTILRRNSPLNVYGPSSVSSCVEGKLKGYSWNLIRDYPAVINVFSFSGKTISHSVFDARDGFRKKLISRSASDGVLLQDPMFKVRAVKMDHDIPCLAYSLEEEYHINIDKDGLSRKGLKVGPWLGEFKKALRAGPSGKEKFIVGGKIYSIGELAGIAAITKGQKICYATDVAMTKTNIARLIRLANESDVFYCEAYFLEEDRKLALERYHLTARTSGFVAKKAAVKKLVLMHFSPRYMDHPDLIIKEAMDEFTTAEHHDK